MNGTLWATLISLALYVALSVAVLVALTVKPSTTLLVTLLETLTLDASREKKNTTTPHIGDKLSGLGRLLRYATYAVYPSSLVTPLRLIMSSQETRTHNCYQLTDYATNAKATGPLPPYPLTPHHRQTPTRLEST
jgi:hypothetical protein